MYVCINEVFPPASCTDYRFVQQKLQISISPVP